MNRSADKRDRENKARRLRNRQTKSEFRTAIKAFDAAVEAGDKEAAEKAMKLSFKLMDSAVNKGVIHHNTSDRKKSRMNVKFNKMQTFTAKFTGAISTSVGMFILGLIGFRSGSGAVQSAATLKGLWYMYTLIPCISLTAAVVLLIFGYKLRSVDAQIMAKANAGEITREEAEASIRGAE